MSSISNNKNYQNMKRKPSILNSKNCPFPLSKTPHLPPPQSQCNRFTSTCQIFSLSWIKQTNEQSIKQNYNSCSLIKINHTISLIQLLSLHANTSNLHQLIQRINLSLFLIHSSKLTIALLKICSLIKLLLTLMILSSELEQPLLS